MSTPSSTPMPEASKVKPHRPASRSLDGAAYVMTWVTLAGVSLGYLALVATRPEAVSEFLPSARLFASTDNTADAHLQAEVSALRRSLADAQLDIARVRTSLQDEVQRSQTLATRLAALEPQSTPAADNAAAKPEAKAAPAAQIAAAPPAEQQTPTPVKQEIKRIAVVTTPEPPAAPTDAARAKLESPLLEFSPDHHSANAAEPSQKPSKLETGSIAAPAAVSFGRATVKPAPQQVGLRIATSTSVDALRLTWSLLSERHGPTLRKLRPRYVSKGNAAAPNFDLMAGPLKSPAEARKLCKELASQGVSCTVANFDGNAL